jgi:iron complex transport system permease protein
MTAVTSRPVIVPDWPAASPRNGVALRFGVLIAALVGVIVAGITVGSVSIPVRDVMRAFVGGHVDAGTEAIIKQVRLPRTITATFSGAALGAGGLQIQTLFANPLADPFVLGISSGASLGVAAVVLLGGGAGTAVFVAGLGWLGSFGTVLAASIGGCLVLGVVVAAGRVLRSSTGLLLVGLMIGYLVAALVTVLLAGASAQRVQLFVEWGFGSYHGVTWSQLHVLVPVIALGLLAAMATSKQLNALLLGERYAASMGIDVRRARLVIISVTSVLAGSVTAFAGPIAFLGIAIPHIGRSLFRTSDHRLLLPACALIGASVALAADILAQLPGDGVLPLNAVNALIGAPIVIVVLVRSSRRSTTL